MDERAEFAHLGSDTYSSAIWMEVISVSGRQSLTAGGPQPQIDVSGQTVEAVDDQHDCN